MKNETGYSHQNPVYRTAGEVIKSANQNREFFNSHKESLDFAWKFYKKL